MLTNEEKKKIEELTKSEYFDYLTEQKLNTKISKKLKYAKWVISSVFSIIVAIGVILGININTYFKDSLALLTKQMNVLKNDMDEFDEKGKIIIADLKVQQSFYRTTFENLKEKEKIYESYMSFMTRNIDDFEKSVENFDSIHEALDSDLRKINEQKDTLDSLEQQLNKKIAESEVLKKQVQSAILTKYMCVERGSKESYKKDYKEVKMNLPDSDSTITVIFYAAKFHKEIVIYDTVLKKSNKRKYKEASVQIIIKDSTGLQTMEQSSLIRELKEVQIGKTRFYIEPLIIYYPPNTVGLHISGYPLKFGYSVAPDFIFLRVFIKEQS